MEAVDSSMSVMDVVAVTMDSVAHRAAGNEETENSLDCVDNANGIEADVEDTMEDTADVTDSTSMEIDDIKDSLNQSAKGDGNDCESDGESTDEETCLEAMTPDGQDYYLRLGDTPRRRSALRLSRIIARQQLLRRLLQGRES